MSPAMTEQDWLSCTDPIPMLEFLQSRPDVSARKLRLFAVACSRRVWDRIEPLGQAAVEVAEAFADGEADADALRAARLACKSAGASASWYAAASSPAVAARNAALSAQAAGDPEAERAAQAALLRDILGNAFKTPALEPFAVPRAAVALASEIYEERSFERAPLLAGALQAAGGPCAAILEHLGGPGPHVRGCWAIDLLLGKQ
jgi:hypothetical protein